MSRATDHVDDEQAEQIRYLDKIERLLRKAERDARLLDGRDFKMRPFAEAYRLLDILREKTLARG